MICNYHEDPIQCIHFRKAIVSAVTGRASIFHILDMVNMLRTFFVRMAYGHLVRNSDFMPEIDGTTYQ